MTREDTKVILEILKAGYPIFYKNMDIKQMTNIANLWSEMFENDDIKQKIYNLTTETRTPAELWNCLQKALKNGIYGATEEFEKLPEEVKMFVKNPAQLKEMAQMDSDVVNSVTNGQFLKQIEVIQARIKEDKQMLPEARKVRELALGVCQDVNLVLGEKNG